MEHTRGSLRGRHAAKHQVPVWGQWGIWLLARTILGDDVVVSTHPLGMRGAIVELAGGRAVDLGIASVGDVAKKEGIPPGIDWERARAMWWGCRMDGRRGHRRVGSRDERRDGGKRGGGSGRRWAGRLGA